MFKIQWSLNNFISWFGLLSKLYFENPAPLLYGGSLQELQNWCFWNVVLEKALENPLYSKEVKTVNPKRNQPWIFTGRTDAEAEVPILWPPDAKSRLVGQGPDAGKDWRQEEKRTTEDEMVGWHHWLNGHEFEQAPGDSTGQGSLVCCSLWGLKKSWTWLSHWTTRTKSFRESLL